LLLDPLEDKVGEVDWEGWWSVVEALVLFLGTPVKSDWAEWLKWAFKEILTNDDNAHASSAEVLLGASKDAANFRPVINWLREEDGGHIDDKWGLDVWKMLEFNALDGFVVAIVEVSGIIVAFPCGWISNINWVSSWIACDGVNFNTWEGKALGFSHSFLGPCASAKIINAFGITNEVEWNFREAEGSTTSKEENSEVFWDLDEFAKVLFGFFHFSSPWL